MKINNETKAMSLAVTDGLTVTIIPNSDHEFLMTNKEVANGYGVSVDTIRRHKKDHQSELSEEKHFLGGVSITHGATPGATKATMWTKRGIVRLGFFIRSERAKLFRDWAEDLILNKVENNDETTRRLHVLEDSVSQLAGAVTQLAGLLTTQTTQPKAKKAVLKPMVIDARHNSFFFAEILGKNVRSIIIDEKQWYNLNDLLFAMGVRTSSYQAVRTLPENQGCKIWIYGNTHPAWFCSKAGMEILINGSRIARKGGN